VAVLDTGDDVAFQAIVDQLNDNTQGLGLVATLVQPSDIDSAAELAPFDVVLIGDDGTDPSPDTFPSALASALATWAQDSDGGIVSVGWIGFGLATEPEQATLQPIIPVSLASGFSFDSPGSVITITSTHPVTTGVTNITIAGTFPNNFSESAAAPTAWGSVFGTSPSGNSVVVGDIPTGTDPGRSVYLGPIYSGSRSIYSDSPTWETGEADQLLEQAVNWAGNVTVDPPPTIVNNGSTAAEGGTDTITNLELQAVDPLEAPADLKYTVTTGPVNGTLQLSGTPTTIFTQADIDASLVTYLHDGSETTSDSFTFTLNDGTTTVGPAIFAITVTPVDDPPTITNNGSTAPQGGSDTINSTELFANDPDTADTALVYTVTAGPANGQIKVDGVAASSFTQQDINDSKVVYTHDGSATSSDAFTFSLSDGTTTISGQNFAITVDPTPVVSMVSIAATKQAAEPGADGEFTVTLSAPTGTPTNVTYNASGSAANGVDYQFVNGFLSIPAGETVGTILIDVIDDALVEGTETVFIALSAASGSPGVILDASQDDATVTIADDDPTASPPIVTTNTGSTVANGGTDTITQTELETTDADTPASGLTYVLTDVPNNGILRREGPTGTFTTQAVGNTFTQEEINLGRIDYVHNGTGTTSDSFSFTVTDGVTTTAPVTFNITILPMIPATVVVDPVTGKLTITGTSRDDTVTITGDGVGTGNFIVTVQQDSGPITTTNVSGVVDICVFLLEGNDNLTMNNIYITGSIEVEMDTGFDTVTLGNIDVVSTQGDLSVDLGTNDDVLNGLRIFIAGDQTILAGPGDDTLTFDGIASPFTLGTSAGGNANWNTGNDDDTVHVVYAFIVGAFSIDLGGQDDSLNIFGSAVSGNVSFFGVGGNDSLTVDTNFFDASLLLDGGADNDTIFLANGLGTDIGTINTGAGDDTVTIRNETEGRINIDTGSGTDEVDIRSSAVDRFFALLGDDNDELTAFGNLVRLETDLDGGAGNADRLLDLGNDLRGAVRQRNFEIFS
jgi:hypothetical protein